MLSIVIPTLDAAATLAATCEAVAEADLVGEMIVADGGSGDSTRDIAGRFGARVIAAACGRGSQLAAGAAVARMPWLLFLHADTRPEKGWDAVLGPFIDDPANAMRAAVFRFALDDAAPAARRLERAVAWRCRALALPYGDQGLLISRPLYDAIGGYPPWPLMEDVAIVRRLGRRRLVFLDVAAVTSAAAYRRDGYLRRPLRNAACLALYFLGVPPRRLAGLYGGGRS